MQLYNLSLIQVFCIIRVYSWMSETDLLTLTVV